MKMNGSANARRRMPVFALVAAVACGLLLTVAAVGAAQSAARSAARSAEVVYLEGFPEIYAAGGSTYLADFGDQVRSGDSVVTGSADYVELERQVGELIKVSADTVFALREVQRGEEKETVLSAAAGQVSFRFDRITGKEPLLGSPTVAAGVRGTEVTVYAGDDGTTLFLVTSGEVAVDSAGEEAILTAGQASEVLPGQAPGEPFDWQTRPIDFSAWNEGRLEDFLESPIESARRIREELNAFAERIDELYPRYEEVSRQLEQERNKYDDILEEEGEEKLREYQREVVAPMIAEAQGLILNVRYNALSALSLRRFVLGKMYMNMKTRFIFDQDAPEYRDFTLLYEDILGDFEERIVPHLVATDI